MRVAVDARSLLCAQPRGEGKSLLKLYQELTALAPDVSAVFFGDEDASSYGGPLPARTEVRILSSRGMRFDFWQNLRLPLASRGLNVLHCTSSSTPLWAPLPVVMTVHDIIPMLGIDGQAPDERARFARGLARGVRLANSIIAVSEHTRSDLSYHFPHSEGRVHVVHWGSPLACPVGQTTDLPPYLLTFGGKAPRKNTEYTIARFAAATRHLIDVRLEVIGVPPGTFRDELLTLALHLQVADRVQIREFVDEASLAKALSRATAVLYFSRYEGFGLPLLEAIAHGTPVLASDRSSIPEVLGDPEACFDLEDPTTIESAITRILTVPEERSRRLKTQATALRRFDWQATAAKTLALLRAAASRA